MIEKYHSVEFSAKRGRLSAEHLPSLLSEGRLLTIFPQQRRKLIQHDKVVDLDKQTHLEVDSVDIQKILRYPQSGADNQERFIEMHEQEQDIEELES
ncbi:hypothetical protein TNCV_2926311 [Trichonephila clavipes]|nr:hypothetical protein TNCV_2926311 [Trichonephila clavipes]